MKSMLIKALIFLFAILNNSAVFEKSDEQYEKELRAFTCYN
jgi:hypothetical protein